MVTIIFEAHSTSFDNESGTASGWSDTRLSASGMEQSKQLGDRYRAQMPDAIFCSDLKRSAQTAMIAFDSIAPDLLFTDWRLRECNYGDLDGGDKSQIDAMKAQAVTVPFPNGESYQQCANRVASFLADLKANFDGKTVVVIGHRATQYGFEHWINNKPLEQVVVEPWQWQPGWQYTLQ